MKTKKTKLDKMGVLVLVSHLIITLAVLAVYVTFALMGKEVGTVEMILMAIVGYWFGAMGPSTVRPTNQTQVTQAEKVEVNKTDKTEVM